MSALSRTRNLKGDRVEHTEPDIEHDTDHDDGWPHEWWTGVAIIVGILVLFWLIVARP
ncbi:MAG TPA: hypothetical protein VFW98_02705 [Gemmatimonadaceae bacterium]|nr:hypothetical protein [Gemmatimonadaceae bacterium]